MTRYFHDVHFHVMTLSHPDFIDYSRSMNNGVGEILFSGLFSPNYIFTPKMRNSKVLLNTTLNALNAFTQPIGKTFVLMEEDLEGKFLRKSFPVNADDYPEQPYIHDKKFHFRGQVYDKLAMSPLVMDFARKQDDNNRSYYYSEKTRAVFDYAEDTLEGIQYYKKTKPDGLLEFFPFIGINTSRHSMLEIKEILNTYISSPDSPFVGVKLYPPLGFNPWPEGNKEDMEKVNFLYGFCEEHNLPVITHCDNQGFRSINVKDAIHFTDPATWEIVLSHYPELKLDFAHFGYKYNLKQDAYNKILDTFDLPMDNSWFRKIIELMLKYPKVYSDLSYSGTMPSFYQQLKRYLESSIEEEREIIKSRILFGSDFSVNLFKVQSYMNYYHIFDISPFSDTEIKKFTEINPANFLGI